MANRLFGLVATTNSGFITVTEFEIALMILDSVHIDTGIEIMSTFDAFYSFVGDDGKGLNKLQFFDSVNILYGDRKTKTNEELSRIYDEAVVQKGGYNTMEYDMFKKIWCCCICDVNYEINKMCEVSTNTRIGKKWSGNVGLQFITESIKPFFFNKSKDLLRRINQRDHEVAKSFISAKEKVCE